MNRSDYELQKISHLLILFSYSALAVGLVAETLLMGWEIWAAPLIIAAVVACWIVHFRQRMNVRQRVWIYTILMMGTFFFYGIHITSTFDLAPLMMIMLVIFTVTGETALVTFCQIVYYVTLAYDVVAMTVLGTEWDSLLISRTALHIVLMFLAGWLTRFIIRRWNLVFRESDARIAALDQTTKRMNQFTANLSHELRTPVNAILGVTEMMLEKEEQDEETYGHLMTVRNAGRRMASQVSDIMDYSEMEMGELTVNAENYMLASLFHDLVTELRPSLKSGVELVINVDAETPAGLISDAGMMRKILYHIIENSLNYTIRGGVYVHVTSIRQSYGLNLCVEVTDTGIGMTEEEVQQISNRFYQAGSGKAVRTGGLGIGLSIVNGFVRALGGFLIIKSRPGEGTTVSISIPQQISDERPCMSVLNREKVCLGGYLNIGKFQDPHVREYYNSMILNVVQGLGTPMHRVGSVEDLKELNRKVRLTHLFVGKEEYDSAPEYLEELSRNMMVIVVLNDYDRLPEGSGALRLPKPLYGFPIASVINSGIGGETDSLRRMRCPDVKTLVVDDEPMNLNVASGLFRKYGMLVDTALSGAEAIRLCRENEYDIVFMDHMMPEMDGVEAMKHIRHHAEKEHREISVVALTANALSSAREMFLAEGFDGFVSKPIEIPELERVLKRILPKNRILYENIVVKKAASQNLEEKQAASGNERDTDHLLASISGDILHVGQGMKYCQNDAEFYLSMLGQFADDGQQKKEKLIRYFEEQNSTDYAITVHALKSTAKTIGADSLSEVARRLEQAAKEEKLPAFKDSHEELLEQYETIIALIRSICPEDPEGSSRADDDEALEFFPDEDI